MASLAYVGVLIYLVSARVVVCQDVLQQQQQQQQHMPMEVCPADAQCGAAAQPSGWRS
jgi:hypothetical protein